MSANKRTVETCMQGFRTGDHSLVVSCMTDDVEWVVPGAFHVRGKSAVDQSIDNDCFEGLPKLTITRLVEEDDVVVAHGFVQYAKKEGDVFEAAFCDVFEMRDAKIARLTSYLVATAG